MKKKTFGVLLQNHFFNHFLQLITFDLRGDFLIEEVEELRLLSALAARSVCFFIFLPLPLLMLHLDELQQGQFKYMYPAIPRIKTPKAKSMLRALIKVDNSSLSKLKAKAEEAHAAKIKPKEMNEDISKNLGVV